MRVDKTPEVPDSSSRPKKAIHTVKVLSFEGEPLMPTRPAKAKWLLKQGKARVQKRHPFTIRLTYSIPNPICQPVKLAIDDGETVGVAAVQINGTHQRVVFAGQMRLRGRDITDALSRRRRLRRARRRRGWKRRQKRRFLTHPLPPSIRADIEAKMRLIDRLLQVLPIAEIRWEPLSFSMSAETVRNPSAPRLLPPDLSADQPPPKRAFRLGIKTQTRLLRRDDKRCCVCGRQVSEKTAFFYRIGRPKLISSYITLCRRCSERVTYDRCVLTFDAEKYTSTRGAGRVMHGKTEFGRRLKAQGVPVFWVNGWRTEQHRKALALPKSHINDAIAIASGGAACRRMECAVLVRLRARHQRRLFFENPGDRDIQRVKRGASGSVRRRARRKRYQERYGGGGRQKRAQVGFRSEPFTPYEGLYVTHDGKRGLIKNRKIEKRQALPARKTVAKMFRRGDVVKTAEGRLAEVVALFSTGKVGIRFLDSLQPASRQRTARIPETLQFIARGRAMQFIEIPQVED